MKYVLYQKSDGLIIGHGTTPLSDLSDMEDAQTGAIEVSDIPGEGYKVSDGEIVEDTSYAATMLEQAIMEERKQMVCSPLQGILALGETEWNKILTYRETATWQEKVIIDSAQDWRRNSENIAFFGYLLGYTDDQIDALFRTAMQIEA